MKKLLFSFFSVFLTSFAVSQIHAQTQQRNILFVLDESGSMWQKIDGRFKTDIAKEQLIKAIQSYPPETKIGVIAFGHREKSNCNDIELLFPVEAKSTNNQKRLIEKINSIVPTGRTPIEASLRLAVQTLNGFSGSSTIILLSDGEEVCDGDPCAYVRGLSGGTIKIEVIGFDVDSPQLACIASASNGSYFTAKDSEGLEDALTQISQQASPDTLAAELPIPQPAQHSSPPTQSSSNSNPPAFKRLFDLSLGLGGNWNAEKTIFNINEADDLDGFGQTFSFLAAFRWNLSSRFSTAIRLNISSQTISKASLTSRIPHPIGNELALQFNQLGVEGRYFLAKKRISPYVSALVNYAYGWVENSTTNKPLDNFGKFNGATYGGSAGVRYNQNSRIALFAEYFLLKGSASWENQPLFDSSGVDLDPSSTGFIIGISFLALTR